MSQMNNYGAAMTPFNDLGAAQLVRGTETKLDEIKAVNKTGVTAFIQLFNAATVAAVTLGTTIPDWEGLVGDSTGVDLRPPNLLFPKGCVIAATTTSKGATPVGAGLFVTTGDMPNETKLARAIANPG